MLLLVMSSCKNQVCSLAVVIIRLQEMLQEQRQGFAHSAPSKKGPQALPCILFQLHKVLKLMYLRFLSHIFTNIHQWKAVLKGFCCKIQAGTLSGNPLAMVAGIKTLEILDRPGAYEHMTKITERLIEGILKAGRDAGHEVTGGSISGTALFRLIQTRHRIHALLYILHQDAEHEFTSSSISSRQHQYCSTAFGDTSHILACLRRIVNEHDEERICFYQLCPDNSDATGRERLGLLQIAAFERFVTEDSAISIMSEDLDPCNICVGQASNAGLVHCRDLLIRMSPALRCSAFITD